VHARAVCVGHVWCSASVSILVFEHHSLSAQSIILFQHPLSIIPFQRPFPSCLAPTERAHECAARVRALYAYYLRVRVRVRVRICM